MKRFKTFIDLAAFEPESVGELKQNLPESVGELKQNEYSNLMDRYLNFVSLFKFTNYKLRTVYKLRVVKMNSNDVNIGNSDPITDSTKTT